MSGAQFPILRPDGAITSSRTVSSSSVFAGSTFGVISIRTDSTSSSTSQDSNPVNFLDNEEGEIIELSEASRLVADQTEIKPSSYKASTAANDQQTKSTSVQLEETVTGSDRSNTETSTVDAPSQSQIAEVVSTLPPTTSRQDELDRLEESARCFHAYAQQKPDELMVTLGMIGHGKSAFINSLEFLLTFRADEAQNRFYVTASTQSMEERAELYKDDPKGSRSHTPRCQKFDFRSRKDHANLTEPRAAIIDTVGVPGGLTNSANFELRRVVTARVKVGQNCIYDRWTLKVNLMEFFENVMKTFAGSGYSAKRKPASRVFWVLDFSSKEAEELSSGGLKDLHGLPSRLKLPDVMASKLSEAEMKLRKNRIQKHIAPHSCFLIQNITRENYKSLKEEDLSEFTDLLGALFS